MRAENNAKTLLTIWTKRERPVTSGCLVRKAVVLAVSLVSLQPAGAVGQFSSSNQDGQKVVSVPLPALQKTIKSLDNSARANYAYAKR